MTPQEKEAEIRRLAAIINRLVVFVHVIQWPAKR